MTLFRNIKIIDSQSPFNGQNKDILVENQIISRIEAPNSIAVSPEMTVVEEKDAYISPGWMDMQVHLSEPGFEWKETMAQTATAATKGGFTTLLCYPETNPLPDNASILKALYEQSRNLNVRFYFAGALTEHKNGKDLAQLFEMHTEKAIAFTDGLRYPQSAGLMLLIKQYVSAFNPLIIVCPYDKSLVGEAQINESNTSLQLGMKGIPEIAETVALAKEWQLQQYSPVRTHFQPVTSPSALNSIREMKKQDVRISCGIPSYYLLLTDDCLLDFDTNFKVFPPLKSKAQVKQLLDAVADECIDVITSGHLPQGLEEKNCEFEVAENGLLNLQTAIPVAFEALVQSGIIKIDALIDKFTHHPRRITGLPAITITQGQTADFTLFNVGEPWTFTQEMIPSTAKNSPFTGRNFSLKVLGTYPLNGKWVKI